MKALYPLLCALFVTAFAAEGGLGVDQATIGTIRKVGAVVADINMNLMQGLIQDPDSSVITSDCIMKTSSAMVAIDDLFNLNKYSGWTSIINLLNVTMIKVMDQFNNCGMNTYMAKIDEGVSTISRASGIGANAAAHVI